MKRRAVLTALIGAALIGAAAASAALASTSTRSAVNLKGAGSSFVAPLIAQWQANYKSASVDYNPIGSGGGIAAITARTVDFGASDAPLSKDEFAACKGCVQIPWALSATSIPYNLDLNKRLKLNGRVLAGIYLGQIKNWSDKRIKALNKGVNLPNLKITPVYRSDNSGTSYNFTDYLSHVNATWKKQIGVGVNAKWPAGIGAPKSNGVAAAVSQTKGALGYVDVEYAIKNHLPFAAVQNAAGRYILPGIVGIKAAAATVTKVPASNEISIVNPPRSQRSAYPICTFTYVILPLNSNKAADLKKFVFWALTAGQQYGPKLRFVPIPNKVLGASEKTLKRVHS
jgi:phosphate transport system substrate-binding protein